MERSFQHGLEIYTWQHKRTPLRHQFVWFVLGIIQIVLGMRFVLTLFGAQASSALAGFMYSSAAYLNTPVTIVFGVVESEQVKFEWVTLLSMLLYWVLAMGLLKVLGFHKRISKIEIARSLSKKKYGYE